MNGLWIIDLAFSLVTIGLNLYFFILNVKNVPKLNINYKNIQIKQHSKVTYLGCILDVAMSGESTALKVINKINSGLKFVHIRKKNFNSSVTQVIT